jgi:hypothetical protein
MFVCCECCVFVRYRSLRRADHSSRGVLLAVVCPCVWSLNLKNEETKTRKWVVKASRIIIRNFLTLILIINIPHDVWIVENIFINNYTLYECTYRIIYSVTAHPDDGQARPKHVGATNWENIYNLCILLVFIGNRFFRLHNSNQSDILCLTYYYMSVSLVTNIAQYCLLKINSRFNYISLISYLLWNSLNIWEQP